MAESAYDRLTYRHQRFVDEYLVAFEGAKAGRSAGYGSGNYGTALINSNGAVRSAVEEKLKEMAKMSELKAEYIRQYILDVLELCPTDYFTIAEDGTWCIDPDEFRKLPTGVKRLVESVETRVERGRLYFTVKFISKTNALAMAAKYTLTQQIAVATTQIPWDDIVRSLEDGGKDVIEAAIRQLELSNGQQEYPAIPA